MPAGLPASSSLRSSSSVGSSAMTTATFSMSCTNCSGMSSSAWLDQLLEFVIAHVNHGSSLFRAEDAVARITQTGNDVGVLVEALVHGGDVDVDIGMGCAHRLDSLRCSN